MSQELLEVVNQHNEPTSQSLPRPEVHAKGLWHRTVHIYVYREQKGEIEILVHLRAKHKDHSPNMWDLRFGGHIKSGETIEQTVIDELEEEIGIKANVSDCIEGPVKQHFESANNEFNHVFYYKFTGRDEELSFNDGEVQEVKWMTFAEIEQTMINEPEKWVGPKELTITKQDFLAHISKQ